MKKVQIKIPASLSDVTLGQYQEYIEVIKNYDEQEDASEVQKDIISIICMVDRDLIGQMPGNQVVETIGHVMTLMSTVKDPAPLINIINLGGLEYGFEPDLEDTSFDVWTDTDTYLKDAKDYHRLMAVVYRKVKIRKKNRYDIEEYETTGERAEIMKLMPLSYFIGAYSFFLSLGIELLESIPSCLESQAASQDYKDLLVALQKNMDGIDVIINYQMEIQQRFERLVSSTSANA